MTKDEARDLLVEIGFSIEPNDDDMTNMLKVFQRSYGLEQTGTVNKATANKIKEVHGQEVAGGPG